MYLVNNIKTGFFTAFRMTKSPLNKYENEVFVILNAVKKLDCHSDTDPFDFAQGDSECGRIQPSF